MFPTVIILMCFYFLNSSASHVIEMTDVDFHKRIKDFETVLVMFYGPWCTHCKLLKPEFEEAARLLHSNDPPVTLARVDCSKSGKDVCSRFSVFSYPTLKIFNNGFLSKEYNGPRKSSGIFKYMRSQVGPNTYNLPSRQDLDKFVDDPDALVIGFFEEGSQMKEEFFKVADKLKEKFRFGYTTAPENLEEYKENIVLYRPKYLQSKFDPNNVVFDGDVGQLETFLKKNLHGLVGHRTTENSDEFSLPLVVAYYNVDYDKNPKGTNYWRNRVSKVAQSYSNDFHFAISDLEEFQREVKEFGFNYATGDKPVVCARSKDNQKFAMKGDFSIDNFEEFLSGLKEGSQKPYVKSLPIPTGKTGPVKVAVGKNFDEVITDNGKDTLIEFFAPWCSHCKTLSPVFDKLGDKMAGEEVCIAKMDAANNDVPPMYDIRGYPTIYWIPKHSRSSPVLYDGGRKLIDFIEFIAERATSELKGYDRSGNEKPKDEL